MPKGAYEVRRVGGRTAKDYTIVIAYDGELTEEEYFRGWKLIIPPSRLTLEPLHVKSGGNALKAVEKSIIKKKKYTNYAEFWCVCDADDTSATDLAAAHILAADNEIRLGLSARCFEVWLALHYAYSTQSINNEKEAIGLIKSHFPEYGDKGKTIPFYKLHARTCDAINNANALAKANLVNPSTNVHHLVRKLLQNTV